MPGTLIHMYFVSGVLSAACLAGAARTTDTEIPWPVVIIVVVGTGFTGWLCILRTTRLVRWAQDNYRRSKVFRWWPGSSLVMKSYYPTYLRCMGVYLWAFGALILGLSLVSVVRR